MCKWHKHAVREAATDPATGTFDAGKYAVGLVAMGLLRIEQQEWQMPELFGVDGFNPEELLSDAARAAYARTGLQKPLADITRALAQDIDALRAALNETAESCDLSAQGLNIPSGVTQGGYKQTCCAPADPRKNGPFLDAAVVHLFKGYDDPAKKNYASGPLELISFDELQEVKEELRNRTEAQAQTDLEQLSRADGLRNAVELLLSQPGIVDTLKSAFRNSLAFFMESAQADLEQSRGLKGASDCIMCEGSSGRKMQP